MSHSFTKDIIKQAAFGIKFLHEGASLINEFVTARNIFEEADVISFLGFGYHAVNVNRCV